VIKELHITAIPFPSSEKELLDINYDIRLVKTSLLYADKVLLFSIIPIVLFSLPYMIGELNKDKETQQIMKDIKSNCIGKLIDISKNYKGSKEEIDIIQEYIKNKNVNLEDLVNELFNHFSNTFISIWNELKSQIGISKLDSAIKAGDLEIYTISKSKIPEYTFPLLDENGLNLVGANIKEGKLSITESGTEKLKQIGLAFNMFQRLPNFDKATIVEILDIRKTLNKPLVRFRSVIIEMSERIKYEPWDEDFKYYVEKVFYQKVEPAILEIEEECKSNKYLVNLLDIITERPWEIPAGGIIGAAISKLAEISSISAAVIGLTLGVGTASYKALNEWKEKTKEIESNQMFFYYRTGKMLNK